MTAECPTLRRDLRISRQQHRGQDVVVVKDPVKRSFFRLSAEEYELLRSMNGHRRIDEVRRAFEEANGYPVEEQRLADLLEKIHSFRLFEEDVESPETVSPSHGEPAPTFRGGILYFRFKMVDPDAFLDALLKKTSFLFTPGFVVPASACILAATVLMLMQWGAYGEQLERLYRVRSVGLIWVTVSVIVMVHELGHGLACKYFGGEVREMGFCLVYFQPCLYTDVSDSYLFAEKGRRLWVMLAGSFIQAFIGALAAFAWCLLPGTGLVKDVCFVIVATSGIGLLFNFNPLLKFDGYYLLCDLLELPNLRGKSFAYLGQRLIRGKRGNTAATGAVLRDGEKGIYLAYGATAIVYSVLLLGYMAYLAFRFFRSL